MAGKSVRREVGLARLHERRTPSGLPSPGPQIQGPALPHWPATLKGRCCRCCPRKHLMSAVMVQPSYGVSAAVVPRSVHENLAPAFAFPLPNSPITQLLNSPRSPLPVTAITSPTGGICYSCSCSPRYAFQDPECRSLWH